MRLRNVPRAAGVIEASSYVVKNPAEHKGSWQKLFGNDKPIHVEIGMGKGKFLTELASGNPQINYIGIEKMGSVIFRAVEKLEAREERLENVLLVEFDADRITDIFDKDEIDKLYLNFSDPWPKERHTHRRLTSDRFLERYTHFLKKEGIVEFKTDNTGLFEYSVKSIEKNGWELLLVENDLHHSSHAEGNIMTEYEERFSSEGNPIHKAVFRQKQD